MHRRTLLQKLARMFAALPFVRTNAFAETSVFTPAQHVALTNLASVVLPSALGAAGFDQVAKNFERYVREYRPGADTDHGYGFTRVIPKPPSPAATYAEQLSVLPSPLTRAAVEQALHNAQVNELPRVPDGKSVVADLMSFYFRSSEANDLCYSAQIGRDQCRGLPGSDAPPKPLGKSA